MLKILNNECRPPADLRPTSTNNRGDTEFKHAVSNRSTKTIVTALWTRACLKSPAVDAMPAQFSGRGINSQLARGVFEALRAAGRRPFLLVLS
ncbi:hypothetical protein [Bradyrhizobium sp. 195]|uniref:hypothetical protein n=1 Tax=Bradyrhizobium sp. 195 TaxID=2782662 RepID=UPI0020010AC4|nr:hypothetical protein [Bradyrhizobium sp. 195]UPK25464.1 hypothetical protein IVB26_29715 [Bradyrhizobium sp. 195]